MSTKRKYHLVSPTRCTGSPTARASQVIRNLELFTRFEERYNHLLLDFQAALNPALARFFELAKWYSTLSLTILPSTEPNNTNIPVQLPNSNEGGRDYDLTLDDSGEEPAAKRQALEAEWDDLFSRQSLLELINPNSDSNAAAFWDSLRSPSGSNQGAEPQGAASVNTPIQQAPAGVPAQQTHLHDLVPPASADANHTVADASGLAAHGLETEMSTADEEDIEPHKYKGVPARTGMTWSDAEKHVLISSVAGPDRKMDPLILARRTSRRSTTKIVPGVWAVIWRTHFENSRELTAVIRELWTLINTFHDIFDLIQFICHRDGITFDQCRIRLNDESEWLSSRLEEAKLGRAVQPLLKTSDVVAWHQNSWFDWFYQAYSALPNQRYLDGDTEFFATEEIHTDHQEHRIPSG
ncbi:hypothetical protein RhiJN_22945 [Ceratobasidium sp. AG-Ba]|nr:hypothetical protein RhiJN_22945 [Ceratobasidium sp. AG-Ba]